MMKSNQLLTAVIAAGILSLSGCQTQPAKPETTAVTEETVTEAATEAVTEAVVTEAETETETEAAENDALFGSFQAITLAGEEVNQEIFSQAGLTMVNIWGTFCPPCIQEMPDLAELSNEYGGAAFQLIGLVSDTMEAGDASAVEIVEQTGADYTHIMISQELYNNYLYTVQAVPTTVFLDRDGRQVGDVYLGAKSKQQWETIIKELLEETGE